MKVVTLLCTYNTVEVEKTAEYLSHSDNLLANES